MLLSLKLENLVLIEHAKISFGSGFNILTGETGAGKSVLLAAIRLISGEKAGTEWIRQNASCAVVEAEMFPYPKLPDEIEPPSSKEPLLIRREVLRSGKSRCFVQDNLVSASFLRTLIRPALHIVDQNSSQYLCEGASQRKMLDAFAELDKELSLFADSFAEETRIRKQYNGALQANLRREEDLSWAKTCIKQIDEAIGSPEEESKLRDEHHILSNAQELAGKVGAVLEGLSESIPRIRQTSHLLETAVKLDATLSGLSQTIKSSCLELQEAERTLVSCLERYELDPGHLHAIEERIAAMEQLKRRFGGSWEEVEKQRARFCRQIEQLSALEEQIEMLQDTLFSLEKQHQKMALQISEKRKIAASLFSKQVKEELRSLNLPYCEFDIALRPIPICSDGIDSIQFLFSANPGLAAVPLEQCASGGELSRLLLAIKTVLAEKENSLCLVFDEIDSNVGGQTAAMLGEKLKMAAKSKQIICVTHFTQVARAASHHFSISKTENNGCLVTTIDLLEGEAREKEYSRMLGVK